MTHITKNLERKRGVNNVLNIRGGGGINNELNEGEGIKKIIE